MLDLLGDRLGLVPPVYAQQVPHQVSAPNCPGRVGTSSVAVIKPTSVADSACVNS